MKNNFHFTFANLELQYRAALDSGYEFITCVDYVSRKDTISSRTIVNRVDIDLSVKKADRLRDIFDRLGVKATFFVRLHEPNYNPFSFENYRILKSIQKSGHEVGYHSEIVDQAAIWGEDAKDCLVRDVEVLEKMLNTKIHGVASHGGLTGLNNLDFWKNKKPSDFGLKYEAYDKEDSFNLFNKSFYISDSEWTRWKCYKNGTLNPSDSRSLIEHIKDNHSLIYLLIHPDTYFDNHIYE